MGGIVGVFALMGLVVGIVSLFYWMFGQMRSSRQLRSLTANISKSSDDGDSTTAHSRTTIPGAQRVDPTPMTDRQLWEQIQYNTRMSADVLRGMWVVVVISMVLSVIGGIAMAAFQ